MNFLLNLLNEQMKTHIQTHNIWNSIYLTQRKKLGWNWRMYVIKNSNPFFNVYINSSFFKTEIMYVSCSMKNMCMYLNVSGVT